MQYDVFFGTCNPTFQRISIEIATDTEHNTAACLIYIAVWIQVGLRDIKSSQAREPPVITVPFDDSSRV